MDLYRLRECNGSVQARILAIDLYRPGDYNDLYRLGDYNGSIQARGLQWIYIG